MQTTNEFIIPRPSEQGFNQGPKMVQRGLCSWERAAPTALPGGGNMFRGLYSMENRGSGRI